jgi:hypothetical protein
MALLAPDYGRYLYLSIDDLNCKIIIAGKEKCGRTSGARIDENCTCIPDFKLRICCPGPGKKQSPSWN